MALQQRHMYEQPAQLSHASGTTGSRTHDLSVASPMPYHYATNLRRLLLHLKIVEHRAASLLMTTV